MVPVAGIWNALGISTMMSGLIFQPSWNVSAAGLSLASPSSAPLSAHAVRVEISPALSVRSFLKCPTPCSAIHGGIFRETTAALIALAHGRLSLYVNSDIGATS